MQLSSWIWLTTGGIVFTAIATKTDIIRNFLSEVQVKGTSGFYYYGYGYGYDAPSPSYNTDMMMCEHGFDPRVDEPYPSEIKKEYLPFDYQNTEAQPRVRQDTLDEQQPLVDELYPSHIKHQYLPPYDEPPGPLLPPLTSYPNYTQPLVPPDINKEIESQEPKKHKKKRHHNNNIHPGEEPPPQQESPYPEPVINAQVECPDDLSTLTCGANCYKNGRLWKIVCSDQQIQDLYPTHPVTPPSSTVPSTPIPPSYHPPSMIHPGTSGQSYYLNQMWDQVPCKESAGYLSCRRQGTLHPQDRTGDYRLDVDVTDFDQDFHNMEITSGGSGSHGDCCCGVTLGVHGPDGDGSGYVYAKTEDWTPTGKKHGRAKYLCDDSGHNTKTKCNQNPQRADFSSGKVHLSWEVRQNYPSQGHVTYIGSVNGVPMQYTDPASWDGKTIWPGRSPPCPGAHDPTRVRVDGAGTNVQFSYQGKPGLMVTPLS